MLVMFARCDGDGGYLLIYTEDIEGDRLKRPHKLCRNITSPRTFTTTNPRLLMVFDSGGHVPGLGFNATYQFITGQSVCLSVCLYIGARQDKVSAKEFS